MRLSILILYGRNVSNHILSKQHLYILYHSLVDPYLTYGIPLWGNANKKYINTLFVLQNRAIRATARFVIYYHVEPSGSSSVCFM